MEKGEPKEFEEKKSRELKKAVEDFFISPNNNQNEVFVEPGNSPDSIKIKLIIKPSKLESADFPPGFSIKFEGDTTVNRVPEKDLRCERGNVAYRFLFKDAQFDINGKLMKLDEIYSGLNLGMQNFDFAPFIAGEYMLEDFMINLRKFDSPHDFILMLHEVGHTVDFDKKNIKDRKAQKQYEESFGLGARERNAWVEALKITKVKKLPILKNVRSDAQEWLNSYQEMFGPYEKKEGLKKITSYEAITNKERKKARTGGSKIKKGGTKIEK